VLYIFDCRAGTIVQSLPLLIKFIKGNLESLLISWLMFANLDPAHIYSLNMNTRAFICLCYVYLVKTVQTLIL